MFLPWIIYLWQVVRGSVHTITHNLLSQFLLIKHIREIIDELELNVEAYKETFGEKPHRNIIKASNHET
jgi:hypothetical protein